MDHIAVVMAETEITISAGTMAEALIVADRRNVGAEMARLIDGLGLMVVNVTAAAALPIASAYGRWGKEARPAGLNFGDCFAYELARDQNFALLYAGGDFARTDVRSAMPA